MTSVQDVIIVTIILFAVGFIIIEVGGVTHSVNVQLLNQPVFANNSNAVSVITHADTAINMTDYIYLALFVGFFLSILITGYLVGGIPIAAPIYFFLVIIFTFIGVVLQNVWADIVGTSTMALYSLNFPITTFILNNLGYFTAIFGLAGILIMFAKPSSVVT